MTNPRKRSSVQVSPNGFPPTALFASRPNSDSTPVEFVQVGCAAAISVLPFVTDAVSFALLQDPESSGPGATPGFLLKLNSDDELIFTFTFVIRQTQHPDSPPTDTHISGLTFAYGTNNREVDNLLTREFHADPNLHKNANVELVGDYGTTGSPAITFEWTWKWKPPRVNEDKSGGWRNSCSVSSAANPLVSAGARILICAPVCRV